jgi:hypothetical protein
MDIDRRPLPRTRLSRCGRDHSQENDDADEDARASSLHRSYLLESTSIPTRGGHAWIPAREKARSARAFSVWSDEAPVRRRRPRVVVSGSSMTAADHLSSFHEDRSHETTAG